MTTGERADKIMDSKIIFWGDPPTRFAATAFFFDAMAAFAAKMGQAGGRPSKDWRADARVL
jgi:hypothetical protein